MTPERGFSQNNVSSSNDIEGRVPKLRFPGFGEPWKKCKLGEVADIVGGGTPNTSIPEFWDGNIDWYAPAEIYNQIYVSSSKRKITKQGYENSSTKLLPVGTVLFTSRAGIGKTAILAKEGCTNQGFQSIVPHNDKLDSYFIFSRTEELKNYGELVGAGSTFVEVSGRQMSNMPLIMPSTIEEQQTIGEYFKHFDNFITLHQQKVDTLKKYKRGLLQKMFPRNGAKVPEIRFPGFTGDWEQRKLGELCKKFTDGNWIEAKDQSSSGIRLIQTGNVGLGEYIDKPNNKKWISEETFERLNCEEVFAGDILISRLPEPAGRACIVPNLGTKMITAVDCTIVRTVNQINSKFLLQYFSLQSYFDKVNTCLAGGTRQRISRSNLDSFDIMVPRKYEEQEAIGNSLYNLDHLITLYQHKLELLAHYKKGLLQQMFL